VVVNKFEIRTLPRDHPIAEWQSPKSSTERSFQWLGEAVFTARPGASIAEGDSSEKGSFPLAGRGDFVPVQEIQNYYVDAGRLFMARRLFPL
jgi:hypothetical protein